jgi:translation initiation factor 1 (eIF-1/SUI1)
MAKKGDKTSVPTSEAGALKHNPFAALAVPRAALPEQPVVSTPAVTAASTRPATPKSRGRLVLRRETKHRGGKPVIIVRGFLQLKDFDAAAMELLAKELKQKLGCGGTVEGRLQVHEHDGHRDAEEPQIVLQGDQPKKVAELLRARGFRVDGVTS